VGFLLVGTYWPWTGREALVSPQASPFEVAPRATRQARVKAVIRTHDFRLLTFTEAPSAAALGMARQPIAMGIKQRSRNGVSLLFPAVQVDIHL
jgi:hypothetical protein